MKKSTLTILMIAILLTSALTACAPAAKPIILTDTQRDDVLAFTEPATDGMLAGLNANDYAAFSKDFDDAMKKSIPETGLANIQKSVTAKIGKYVSREVSQVEEIGQYYRVTYKAKYESDDAVTMLVSFEKADPHKVAGLFFTSDKLKK